MTLIQQCRTNLPGWALAIGRTLGSVRLAIALVLALAVALAWGATLSTRHSPAHARWYVYDTWWFFCLLTLLAMNRFCDAALRLTAWRQHIGFLIAHSGLLAFLVGALWSLACGANGHITLATGQSTNHTIDSDRSQITAFWVGKPQEQPFEFTFKPGPVDWPARKTLDLGRIDRVQARLLAYLQQPRPLETWIPDESGRAGPVVKFKLLGPDGKPAGEGWLSDQQFGDAVAIGPIRLQLERAVSDQMVNDFLQPRLDDLGEKGLLLAYYGDDSQRISIDQSLGQTIPLAKASFTVEVAEYLPNAVPDRLGRFTTKGDHPKNPMVELRVNTPDQKEPLRQIAFAKDPFLNLDGVYSTVCPVKFRFYHPAVKRQTSIELMQDSHGRLLARLHEAGTYTPHGEIHVGDKLVIPGSFQLEVLEHIPHALAQLSFVSDDLLIAGMNPGPIEPAGLIEIKSGNTSKQVWLRRNDPTYGQAAVALPGGTLALKFEPATRPLRFSMTLIDSNQPSSPYGPVRVRIVDPLHGLEQEKLITKKQPLMQRGLIIRPSLSESTPHGSSSTTFVVTYDPGLLLRYLGGLLGVLGIALSFVNRHWFVRRVASRPVVEHISNLEYGKAA